MPRCLSCDTSLEFEDFLSEWIAEDREKVIGAVFYCPKCDKTFTHDLKTDTLEESEKDC